MQLNPESLQLLPIKLVPGFIAVDFVLGCVGCNFCVARRNPLIKEIFDTRAFTSLVPHEKAIFDFLFALPSFSSARVPLRIGNDSDLAFQRESVRHLLTQLAPDYPAVVLTRFPIESDDAALFSEDHKNTLLKVTLTPKSRYVDSPADAFRVIESIEGVRGNLLVTIGPLVEDNFIGATNVLQALPQRPKLSVYLKPLDKEGLPHLAQVPEISGERLRELEYLAEQRGFRLNSFMLCLVFGPLGREDPRSVDIPKNELRHCFWCDSRNLCWRDKPVALESFSAICAELGLRVESVTHTGFRAYKIAVDSPTAYGDEAYLSYMVGRKIRFANTSEGTLGHTVLASPSVIRRWGDVGFLPVERLKRLATM